MLEQSEYVRKILISFMLYRSSGESFATKSSIANYVHHVNVMAEEDMVSYLCKPVWAWQVETKTFLCPCLKHNFEKVLNCTRDPASGHSSSWHGFLFFALRPPLALIASRFWRPKGHKTSRSGTSATTNPINSDLEPVSALNSDFLQCPQY